MSIREETHGDYAYGGNYIEHCECPAVAAGFEPSGSSIGDGGMAFLEAAESYDEIVKDETGEWEGMVAEEDAKEAWLTMLEDARTRNLHYANAAHRVAERLGWLNEGEE